MKSRLNTIVYNLNLPGVTADSQRAACSSRATVWQCVILTSNKA